MLLRILALLTLALALSSCASLSEDQCRAGDWRQIGFKDGADGREAGFLERHREACAKYGVVPNQSLWLEGREEGLRLYCTPQNAYKVGRDGRTLNRVCTAAEHQAMEPAYRHGRRYWQIRDEIDDLEREQSDIRRDMAVLSAAKPPATARIASLQSEYFWLETKIARLRGQARRYDTWPP